MSVSVYVIELGMNDDVTMSHMFLLESSAYRVSRELASKVTVDSITIIKRTIHDETGVFEDEILLKMDFKKEEEKYFNEDVQLPGEFFD